VVINNYIPCRLWIINVRQYANIVPSPGDVVYGAIYEIDAEDEAKLDVYEGVPESYEKQRLPVSVQRSDHPAYPAGESSVALIYIDYKRTGGSFKPKEEYIDRMNAGIADAVKEGVPDAYIEKYLRPYIPTK
jgi:gamma-glutamylcyclotransferase